MKGRSARKSAAATTEDERVAIGQRAAVYCLMTFPTLWTAGVPVRLADSSNWIVPVVVRYPTGHEKELGQLSYDGESFALLTTREVMAERARELQADPLLMQAWHEHQRSSVPPGKA